MKFFQAHTATYQNATHEMTVSVRWQFEHQDRPLPEEDKEWLTSDLVKPGVIQRLSDFYDKMGAVAFSDFLFEADYLPWSWDLEKAATDKTIDIGLEDIPDGFSRSKIIVHVRLKQFRFFGFDEWEEVNA